MALLSTYLSMKKNLIRGTILTALLVVAGTASTCWLRAAYDQRKPKQVALEFHRLLLAGQYPGAFDLSIKQAYVGKTAAELQTIANRQCLNADQIKYTTPFQSNGNRLRRWWMDKEVEMEQVSVELEGPCLLEVRLKHTGHGKWRVTYFASHAG